MDLEELRHIFPDPPIDVRKVADQYLLALELPDDVTDDESGLAAAEDTLQRLNGIARCRSKSYRAPTISGVSSIDPSTGLISTRVQLRGLKIEARGGVFATADVIPGPGKATVTHLAYGTSVLKLARLNPHLERALFLYGSVSHNWRGLYMVLEAAEDAFGGEKKLLAEPWVSPKLKHFKETANSYHAVGAESRHGSLAKGVASPKISLSEAQQVLWEFLNAWIAKLQNP